MLNVRDDVDLRLSEVKLMWIGLVCQRQVNPEERIRPGQVLYSFLHHLERRVKQSNRVE